MTLEATLKEGEYFYLLKNLKEPMLVCTEPNSTSMKALELSPLEPIVQEHVIINIMEVKTNHLKMRD